MLWPASLHCGHLVWMISTIFVCIFYIPCMNSLTVDELWTPAFFKARVRGYKDASLFDVYRRHWKYSIGSVISGLVCDQASLNQGKTLIVGYLTYRFLHLDMQPCTAKGKCHRKAQITHRISEQHPGSVWLTQLSQCGCGMQSFYRLEHFYTHHVENCTAGLPSATWPSALLPDPRHQDDVWVPEETCLSLFTLSSTTGWNKLMLPAEASNE